MIVAVGVALTAGFALWWMERRDTAPRRWVGPWIALAITVGALLLRLQEVITAWLQ